MKLALGWWSATLILLVLTVIYFFPLFTGHDYSTLAETQSVLYPWKASPNPFIYGHVQTDQAELSYPWSVAEKAAFERNELVFWEPGLYGGGYDLFANGSSGQLYPVRQLFLRWFDPARAHDAFSFFHVFFAGLAMLFLGRALHLTVAGSTWAAAVWMLGTWHLGWLHLEVIAPLPMFLPLGLAAVHLAFSRQSWPWAIGAGLIAATMMTSGHVLLLSTVFLALMLQATAWSIVRTVRARSHRIQRLAIEGARTLVVAVIGSVGAAAVLVPTALQLRTTQRDPFDYATLAEQVVAHPWMLRHLFVPPHLPTDEPSLQFMVFIGTVTAGLAVFGFFLGRGAAAILGRALVVGTALIALGGPVTWLFFHLVPGFDVLRPYTRLLLFISFGWAILSGAGVDRLLGWADSKKQVLVDRTVRVGLIVAFLFTTHQLLFYGSRLTPKFVPRDPAFQFPSTPWVEAARGLAGDGLAWPGRLLPLNMFSEPPLPAHALVDGDTALAVGLDSTTGYDSSLDRRAATLERILEGEEPTHAASTGLAYAYDPRFDSPKVRYDLARRLGITAVGATPATPGHLDRFNAHLDEAALESVYGGPDGRLWKVAPSAPGPRLIFSDTRVDGEREALSRFIDPTFDFERTVLVEPAELRRAGLTALGGDGADGSGSGAAITHAERHGNRASIQADSPRAAWLLISDHWAPGWSATINGLPAPVVRVNYDQRAVRLDAGTSDVQLRYRSPGFAAGAWSSALVWSSSLVILAWLAWSRRTRAPVKPIDPG